MRGESISFLIIFIFNQIVGLYLIARAMDLMLEKSINTRKKYILYVLHFIINNVVYFYIGIPIIQLITTVVTLYILTYAYNVDFRSRIEALVIILTISFISEYLGYVTLGITDMVWIYGIQRNTALLTMLSTVIKSGLVYMLYRVGFKLNHELDERLRFYFITMPFITVILLVLIITLTETNPLLKFIISSVVLILMFYIIYSYRKGFSILTEKYELDIVEKQNELYKKELENINLQNEKTMILRHDFKNIVYKIRELANREDYKEIDKIISKYYIDHFEEYYINTGNIDFDSIMNYKMGIMKNKNIKCNHDLLIPPYNFMESYDLMILLGNLLDNAIEANLKLEDNRWIHVTIKLRKGILEIQISNPIEKKIRIEEEMFIETDKDKEGHGYGLKSVYEIVSKYNGMMKIFTENEIFYIDIKIVIN